MSAGQGRLEAARHNVIEALARHGVQRVDRDSPIRLLRAYFGERWSGDPAEMNDDHREEAAAFLERLALEARARIAEQRISRMFIAWVAALTILAYVDSVAWPAKARTLPAHHQVISR